MINYIQANNILKCNSNILITLNISTYYFNYLMATIQKFKSIPPNEHRALVVGWLRYFKF